MSSSLSANTSEPSASRFASTTKRRKMKNENRISEDRLGPVRVARLFGFHYTSEQLGWTGLPEPLWSPRQHTCRSEGWPPTEDTKKHTTIRSFCNITLSHISCCCSLTDLQQNHPSLMNQGDVLENPDSDLGCSIHLFHVSCAHTYTNMQMFEG